MKAKRLISGFSALTLAAAMALSASAVDDDTNRITPDKNGNPNPESAGTEVTYKVDPEYTITIPASVTLTNEDVTDTIKIEGKEAGSMPRLESGQKVIITLSDAANGFDGTTLTVKANEKATANYTVEGKNGKAGKDAVVAEFEYTPEKTAADFEQKLKFTAPTGVQYAGEYKDQLTFTVKVESPETFKTLMVGGVEIKYKDGETWGDAAQRNGLTASIYSVHRETTNSEFVLYVNNRVKITSNDYIDPEIEYYWEQI